MAVIGAAAVSAVAAAASAAAGRRDGGSVAFLSGQARRDIAQAIAAVEAKTRGELVTVVACAADDYAYVPLLWAALLALAIPGVILLSGATALAAHAYTVQVIAFLALAILFSLPPVKLRLVPRALRHARAHRLAVEQFFAQNLHHTAERTGVLIFVSVAERYVEILADEGIHQRMPAGAWDQIVTDFTAQVRAGRIAAGFLQAIDACGARLIEHFPARAGDRNELPDRLIEL
jgi:putative membrane protein